MVVPAYPFGAEMVKSSCVSLIIFGRGMAGAIVVGTGTGVVGIVVKTVAVVTVGKVVGTVVKVGIGWTLVWVHPAAISRTAIAQESAKNNKVFITPHTRRS